MAYQKLADLGTDTVVALGFGEGKQAKVEGYYLGARTVNTANGESNIHVFQTPKGNLGVWGTKKLNDNLTNKGVMTLVEYKGKVKLQGGKTQHTYEFMIDPDNTIEVAGLPEAPMVAEGDDEENDQQSFDFAGQQNRTAAVQELLKRGKSK